MGVPHLKKTILLSSIQIVSPFENRIKWSLVEMLRTKQQPFCLYFKNVSQKHQDFKWKGPTISKPEIFCPSFKALVSCNNLANRHFIGDSHRYFTLWVVTVWIFWIRSFSPVPAIWLACDVRDECSAKTMGRGNRISERGVATLQWNEEKQRGRCFPFLVYTE